MDKVLKRARGAGMAALRIGKTGGSALEIVAQPLAMVSVRVEEIREGREGCLRGIAGE